MDSSSGERDVAGTAVSSPPDLVGKWMELDDQLVETFVDIPVDGSVQSEWASPTGLLVAGRGVAGTLKAVGSDRFEAIKTAAQETFSAIEYDGPSMARPRALGGFSFHQEYEPTDLWAGFPAASFVIPRVLVTRFGDRTWLTAIEETDSAARETLSNWQEHLRQWSPLEHRQERMSVRSTTHSTTQQSWHSQVDGALDRIADETLDKVVIAQALSVDVEPPIDLESTLVSLGIQYPSCYRFRIDREETEHNRGTFFGVPPEQLVSKHGTTVRTEALAGSVPRGETEIEDESLVDRMVDSSKIQCEHGHVVDAIRSQLSPLTSGLDVGQQRIRRLATIQHLWTPIEATLDADRHVLDLVDALHPTPAVGGVPPDEACETIRRTETFERGWYAAPVGWFDAAGDGEFAAGIRSGFIRDDQLTVYAGNGIVEGSDPDEEWAEVQLKYRPILDEFEHQ